MSDQCNRLSLLFAFSLTLLMVVAAGAANEDLRLVDAVKNQDFQEVRALLGQHANVNVRSEDGSTALLWVAHWNDLQTAELLIRAGADANLANDFRMTPLSRACTNGNAQLVDRYCLDCHDQASRRGGLSLESVDLTASTTSPELREKVMGKLRHRQMPPLRSSLTCIG